jgi:hypothetical protein
MALKEILDAVREDIIAALGGHAVEGLGMVSGDGPLDARTFARVFYIAQRAEAMACAEDRPDELSTQTRCLSELEGKAPRTCEAIKEALTGGNHLVKEALRQLERDRKLVLEAGRELRHAEEALNTRTLALGSGRPVDRLRLASNNAYAEVTSMDNTRRQKPHAATVDPATREQLGPELTALATAPLIEGELEGELEGEFVEDELPPIQPVKLDLPRDPELDADQEIDTENELRKEDIGNPVKGFRF